MCFNRGRVIEFELCRGFCLTNQQVAYGGFCLILIFDSYMFWCWSYKQILFLLLVALQ